MATAQRLQLPTVTLCAVDTRSHALVIQVLKRCMRQVDFARVVLFTHQLAPGIEHEGIEVVDIGPIASAQEYSEFTLKRLADWIQTEHLLIVQWDGFVINPSAWQADFLTVDYIGAPWGKAQHNYRVGNGGFSLRSQKLLQALKDSSLTLHHPEDVCICQTHRAYLEKEHSIRFAPLPMAQGFAFENEPVAAPCFGFHGVYNLPGLLPEAELQEWLQALPVAVVKSRDGYKTARALVQRGQFKLATALLRQRRSAGQWDFKSAWLSLVCSMARLFRFMHKPGT